MLVSSRKHPLQSRLLWWGCQNSFDVRCEPPRSPLPRKIFRGDVSICSLAFFLSKVTTYAAPFQMHRSVSVRSSLPCINVGVRMEPALFKFWKKKKFLIKGSVSIFYEQKLGTSTSPSHNRGGSKCEPLTLVGNPLDLDGLRVTAHYSQKAHHVCTGLSYYCKPTEDISLEGLLM